MAHELKARVCTDALIAPLSAMNTLYLKIDCPDGSQIITGANAPQIKDAARNVLEQLGLDVMPLVLADIERQHRDIHPYSLRMPGDLIAMIEPVAAAAE